MTGQSRQLREHDILATMTRLADTLVSGFDQLDLLRDLCESCTRILDADAAGVAVAEDEELRFVVATGEDPALIDLFRADHTDGPGRDAFRARRYVAAADIASSDGRWHGWTARAHALGYAAVDVFPMRLRDAAVGVLSVYATRARGLGERDVAVGQALADIATTGLLHARAIADQGHVRTQLQHALDSRVVIEQAKGVIAERDGTSPDVAFDRVRRHARSTGTSLAEVARGIVAGETDLSLPA